MALDRLPAWADAGLALLGCKASLQSNSWAPLLESCFLLPSFAPCDMGDSLLEEKCGERLTYGRYSVSSIELNRRIEDPLFCEPVGVL